MRTVSYRLADLNRAIIPLGFVGENQHTRILFDAKKVFDDYPAAVPSMTVQPPQGASYPAVVVRDGDIVTWDVSDSDLIHAGTGELQLAFIEDEVKVRTFIARTRIDRSIVPTGEIPEPLDDFLEEASAAVAAIPQEVADGVADGFGAITAAAETLTPGSSATADFDSENKVLTIGVPEGERGQTGPAGADGAPGKDGKDGKDGTDGVDGFSPTATVTKSGKTVTIAITDKNGTTTETVSDGEDADPTELIDDTSTTATNRTWSASKLNNAITSKQDAPSVAGTSGQVFALDSNLAPVWTTPQSGGVSDVQVNGTSVVQSGVANVPVASENNYGAVKTYENGGTTINSDGKLVLYSARPTDIKQGNQNARPIVPANQKNATFFGLASAAGDSTQSASSNGVGTYTDTAKDKIMKMIGILDMIAPYESTGVATRAYSAGDCFIQGSKLYRATASISIGVSFSSSNCEQTTLMAEITR